MALFSVVLDACVIYPPAQRDVLLSLAKRRIFKAYWSDRIHDEWMRNVHQNQGISMDGLKRIRALMDKAVDDALVTGFDDLIEGLQLPDADDRHVLAAAIHCGANAIITSNLKDFPAEYLKRYGIDAIHPDDFIAYQIDMAPGACCGAIKEMRQRLRKPALTPDEFLTGLRSRLPKSAGMLSEYKELI
ncbi:PIN domain-containing protein [Oceanobacter kriegii]|uniref:PIN domain-containing protein n=1 Tax=Oceanobacter kriegii TaxID=64972 RepID=UPI0006883F03|nr:PIN domain-containing protein [Oceanobacter kriegii]